MTPKKATDWAAIDRLTDAINALTAAIKERNERLEETSRVDRRSVKLLTDLLGVRPKRKPARKRAP